MPYTEGFSETRRLVEEHDIRIQKKYGQNFLTDKNILEKITNAADLTEEDCVLEIGPGLGAMTRLLCQKAGKVIAVEIDRQLIPVLKETLSEFDNLTIINEDILKVDLFKLSNDHCDGKPFKVVANLPYYITTPIIFSLLENGAPVSSITVMVQKEVADRMQTGPGSKDYGALSLAVQYYADPEIVVNVPPECFIPRPHVGSAVINLKRHAVPPVEVMDDKKMFRLIRASFNQRRKTLANALSNGAGIPREETVKALENMGLSETIRGEALTLEQFAKLSDLL